MQQASIGPLPSRALDAQSFRLQGRARPCCGYPTTRQCLCTRSQRRHVTAHAEQDYREPLRREQAHMLSRLYHSKAAAKKPDGNPSHSSSDSSIASSNTTQQYNVDNSTSTQEISCHASGPAGPSDSAAPCEALPGSPLAPDEMWLEPIKQGQRDLHYVPLWCAQDVVLPGGCQHILHVHTPHYCNMFERMFSHQQGYNVFGHLYAPDYNKLGQPDSLQRKFGTLMEVKRAVRTMDGKLIVLATSLCCFQVHTLWQRLSYPVANVVLQQDDEELQALQQHALRIVAAAAPEDTDIPIVMTATAEAQRAGAAAAAWAWMRYYELEVARRGWWLADNPKEGSSMDETRELLQQVVADGVYEVAPLPRIDESAQAEAIARQIEAATWSAMEEEAASMLKLQNAKRKAHAMDLPNGNGASTSTSTNELLQLELSIWSEVDIIVALSEQLKDEAATVPLALLQLRPPLSTPVPASASDTAAGDPSATKDTAQHPRRSHYHLAANRGRHSDSGLCAPKWYCPVRRAWRLSWVAPQLLLPLDAPQRQALLQHGSIGARLRFVLAALLQLRKELAAMAAVKGLSS